MPKPNPRACPIVIFIFLSTSALGPPGRHRLLHGPWSAVALILLFSSYHVLTIGALAPGPGGVALMLAAVVTAAGFWTWSRRRWNSLWPALLSHAGASVGYMLVCAKLLEGNP